MELTKSEKRTIFNILVLIMEADLIENPAEIAYLDKVFHDFEMTLSEFDHMEGSDLDLLCAEFSKFSTKKKEL